MWAVGQVSGQFVGGQGGQLVEWGGQLVRVDGQLVRVDGQLVEWVGG